MPSERAVAPGYAASGVNPFKPCVERGRRHCPGHAFPCPVKHLFRRKAPRPGATERGANLASDLGRPKPAEGVENVSRLVGLRPLFRGSLRRGKFLYGRRERYGLHAGGGKEPGAVSVRFFSVLERNRGARREVLRVVKLSGIMCLTESKNGERTVRRPDRKDRCPNGCKDAVYRGRGRR